MNENEVVRSLRVELFFPDDDEFQKRGMVRDALLRYREACRRGCAALFASECAGAKIEEGKTGLRVKPDTDKAKKILELMFDGKGKSYGYAMRSSIKDLLPNFRSDYADFALREIAAKWSSKDAQFSNARRNWLALNFSRRLVWFSGIPLPFRARNVKLSGHKVTFGWTKSTMEARLCSMNPRDWREYVKIRDGEYRMGSCFLNERRRRGKLRMELRIAYYKTMSKDREIDPRKVLEVCVAETPEQGFSLRIRDGETLLDQIRNRDLNVTAALAWLDRLAAQEDKLAAEHRSSGGARGNNHRKARRSIVARRNGVSKCRSNGSRTWNHKWANTIRNVARGWKCGKVIFIREEELFLRPWQWFDFEEKLRYKLSENGIKLSVVKLKKEDVEELDRMVAVAG